MPRPAYSGGISSKSSLSSSRVIDEPLVEPEIFEKVQAILSAKSTRIRQVHALHAHREKFTYRGLLLCECGKPLYTIHAARPYYRCRDNFVRRSGKRECNAPSMKKAQLEETLDRFFAKTFTQSHFLAQLLKRHASIESRAAITKRREGLLLEQKALAAKRTRVLDFALEGMFDRAERDRRLRAVDSDLEANRKALGELVEPAMPSYAEWQRIFRPFARGFAALPIDEKRRLVADRFQEIKVADYKVVSLYLLTGEKAPLPQAESLDATPAGLYSHNRPVPEFSDRAHRL